MVRLSDIRGGFSEAGQTMVEFAIIATLLLMLVAGVIDVGRGFFTYTEISSAARFAARWGAVVGGVCASPNAVSSKDVCNELGSMSGNFWTLPGNLPLQGLGKGCPSYSSDPTNYYTVANYSGNAGTTIVGEVAQRFDSSNTSSGFFGASSMPGIDLVKLKACIETSSTSVVPGPGDTVRVVVYYPFQAAGPFFSAVLPLTASSEFRLE